MVFAGSPAFAVTQLDALYSAGVPLVGVLSQPPRKSGRKQRLTPTPVAERAEALGLPVATPVSLKRQEGFAELAAMKPDLLIVAAYGLILPKQVLALPAGGCLNVHASLLPRWRGAAPVERALLAGDAETGVCIMQMDEGLDTGPVHLARSTAIEPLETGGELEARLAELGAAALLKVLAAPERHAPIAQPDTGVSYASKLDREDASADFEAGAAALARRIRALSPRLPVTLTSEGGQRLRLLRARALVGKAKSPLGTVVDMNADDGLVLACQDSLIAITELQLVGGKGTVLSGPALANALKQRLAPGDVLTSA